MNRRQAEQLKKVAVGMFSAIFLLIAILGVTIVKKRRLAAELEEQWRAAQAALAEQNAPVPPDPFENLEANAIAKVRDRVVVDAAGARTTVGARVDANVLGTRVEALQRPGVSAGEWVARRLSEHSVYEVVFRYTFHSVEFGPRWYVQMNPEGPQPDGSEGVVPVNGLSNQLHRADVDEGVRYLNRDDEVLQALTEHRFGGGTRLGSALLVFFAGRGDDAERRIIGWLVVPEATDPEQDLIYRAYFQSEEGGTVQDAWWEVNLTNRGFHARDLQANEIMSLGGEVALADVIDIRPRTMDLTAPPESEADPRRRALRYLLANDRLVEAVGTLLSFRSRNTALEYVGWEPNVTAERHVYDVACLFNEGAEEYRVTWRVDANTGVATPTSDISQTAQLALEIVEES